jgi:hypothetical protein
MIRMAIHREEHIPGLSPEQVRERLLDEQTWQRYAELTHALSHELALLQDPPGSRLHRTMPTNGLPGPARGLLGDRLEITEEVRWTGEADATLTAEVPQVGARIAGAVVLAADGDGTRLTVDAPNPSLPWKFTLFAGQVSEMVEAAVGKLADAVRG